jgi:hypothetical protein
MTFSTRRTGAPWLLALAIVLGAADARADRVVPNDEVVTRVVLRSGPGTYGRDVGSLRPGDSAEYLHSEKGWHRVVLNGTPGFVSAAWTRLIPEPKPEPATFARVEPAAPVGLADRLREGLRWLLGFDPEVEFLLQDPIPGLEIYHHPEPNLPVAGFATDPESRGDFDVVVVIDVSTSTSEFAEVDVNGDGLAENRWMGNDSILKAQTVAADNFAQTLKRLPGNHEGERIRLAVVTFSGDETYRLYRPHRNFRATPEQIYELARRDAEIRIPLTHDYDAVSRELRAIGSERPRGTTNFAAGIGRAVIELLALEGEGAESEPRHHARKAILFMTDGKPRLPYDRHRGERAALRAAKLASRERIRINAFALGRNAVTRRHSEAVQRMSRRTGGNFVQLDNPGDIVTILNATSFGYVDRVKLINRTLGRETPFIATGIDGSFYGELPLEEGDNEIRIVAMLHDDDEAVETFTIQYRYLPPASDLEDELSRVRGENEAMMEEIRARLQAEMEAAREAQRKELELDPER